jgi:mono/diheme cytochrome c family protein
MRYERALLLLIPAALLAGAALAEEEEAATAEELLAERCTLCHGLDRVDAVQTDAEGWGAILDRMVSYGARLDESERETLLAHLLEAEEE